MIVSPPSKNRKPRIHTRLGEHLGIIDNSCGIRLKLGRTRLLKRDSFGRHHMGQWTAEHHRAALIDLFGKIFRTQNHTPSGTAQGLVCGRRNDMGMSNRIKIARENFASHQPGKMRHIDHKNSPHFIGNLSKNAEINFAWISTITRQKNQRFDLSGLIADFVVIDQTSFFIYRVCMRLKHAPGHIDAIAMREMPPGCEIQPEELLIAQLRAKRVPCVSREIKRRFFPHFFERDILNAPRKDRPKSNHIGICPRMGLNISVISTKEITRQFGSLAFNRIYIVTTGVKAVIGDPLGVFIGKQIAHRQLRGQRTIILAGNHLEIRTLVGQLAHNIFCHIGRYGGDLFQRGQIGDKSGIWGGILRQIVGKRAGHGYSPRFLPDTKIARAVCGFS